MTLIRHRVLTLRLRIDEPWPSQIEARQRRRKRGLRSVQSTCHF
jgi:hypothetical protein